MKCTSNQVFIYIKLVPASQITVLTMAYYKKMCSAVLVLPQCVLCISASVVAHAQIFQALLS
jgi:hypothetical protein